MVLAVRYPTGGTGGLIFAKASAFCLIHKRTPVVFITKI